MDIEEKVQKLEDFKAHLANRQKNHDTDTRAWINQNQAWVRREVIEAGCFYTMTISPPPAVGGLVIQNVDPFSMMFNPPYLMNLIVHVRDMIDQTIGALRADPVVALPAKAAAVADPTQKGYAFIAMPIDPTDAQLEDVLDAIKEAAYRCGIQAERVDEPHSNERITDRILESIQKAEYVIVDLSGSRPNVFYEAGYAQGLKKTPIYIAREGTQLEFDLKDYPIIFFKNMKDLKDSLERRIRGLAEARAT